VSICGPSGAGKSQLARLLADELGPDIAARIPVDYFFVPRPQGMPPDVYLARPLRWDWALLKQQLTLPMGTVTSTPDADFETFQRRSDGGGLPFTIRPVMICDAMAACPGSNLVVVLEVPADVRRERIAGRDQRWGTRVADRWQHLEETWRSASTGLVPDLVLDGTVPVAMTAARLGQWITNSPAGPGPRDKKERSS
jgi:uridine kinase